MNTSGRPLPNPNCFLNPDTVRAHVTPSPITQRGCWAPARPGRPVRAHNRPDRTPDQPSFLEQLNNSQVRQVNNSQVRQVCQPVVRVSFEHLNGEPISPIPLVTFIGTRRTDPSTWRGLELDDTRPDDISPDLSDELENINLGESP